MKKVYIIGNIPTVIDKACKLKFYNAHVSLFQRGFSVINPMERLTDSDIGTDYALKKNFQDLVMSDAVYILPCVNLSEGKKNLEIMYAINFNLLILHGVLDLTPDIHEITISRKTRKVKVIDQNSDN